MESDKAHRDAAWQDEHSGPAPEPVSSNDVPPFAISSENSHHSLVQALPWIIGGIFVLGAVVAGAIAILRSDSGTDTPEIAQDSSLVIAPDTRESDAISPGTSPEINLATVESDERFSGVVVCLDPGHGGADRGGQHVASAAAPALDESYVSLTIAEDLANRLEDRGFSVVITRDGDNPSNINGADTNLDGEVRPPSSTNSPDPDELQARIDSCNDADAQLLLSIHANSVGDPSVHGYASWFSDDRSFSPYSKLFAAQVNEELGIQLRNAGLDPGSAGVHSGDGDPSKIPQDVAAHMWLLEPETEGMKEPSSMPGVITQVLTISNDDDVANFVSGLSREAILVALDQAVVRYFDYVLDRPLENDAEEE